MLSEKQRKDETRGMRGRRRKFKNREEGMKRYESDRASRRRERGEVETNLQLNVMP